MFIARQKRQTNIAEYILYMWQVEDLIRAHYFDIDKIETNLISQYAQPSKIKEEIRDWYADLILMMHEEGIRQNGHLSFLKTLMCDLNEFHLRLLNNTAEIQYHQLYLHASQYINELKAKSGNQIANDIETCMNALYGLLLLRLKKKEVSRETGQAMATFSQLIAALSKRFLEAEHGEREN
ncbi:MAG: DUF4924 family protein [Bacteroidales bacterium]|nr:DUF4924 family protein [Bacteroidales bacterium]